MTDEDWTEINEWIEDVHTGSDGFYIESRLVVALRDEVEAWRAIARDVAATPPAYREQPEEWYCVHCGAHFIPTGGMNPGEYEEAVAYRMLRHSAACPVTKARALLGETT
jgi:hypothetical protein